MFALLERLSLGLTREQYKIKLNDEKKKQERKARIKRRIFEFNELYNIEDEHEFCNKILEFDFDFDSDFDIKNKDDRNFALDLTIDILPFQLKV